ncbi:para-aminobenzoate synthetase / 4-amino-4-deoxychorismate lyase [Thermoflexales bacterium]|nr:para-aminobenzoate synthetase / 4-amino-4-deoxychorismate lyase [Thermoflexales bacterium]
MPNQVIVHCPSVEHWLRFTDPVEIVSARSLVEVLPALQRLEAQVRTQRLYAAGYLAYEAAPAFDAALRVCSASGLPLLWFGLYKHAEPIELPAPDRPADPIGPWEPTITWLEYERAINTIKDHIAAGRTYQVNYTYRLRAPFTGDPWTFFLQLARQQNNYAAYLELDRWVICSASPELFFKRDGQTVISKPMKGTAPRGRTSREDRVNLDWLQHSEKNRAENVMIVDMIRNDLGRVAQIGSVEVPQLFEVERYPTVLQMTSTVAAQTGASFVDLMTALFPCASITGAPKVSTMKMIAELETTPRGVYTGAIGYLAPGRSAQFNVAIRTVTLDRETGCAEYGVGGGIVWDSDAADEYRECEIKTRVLTNQPLEFDLLEALLWTPVDGYFLLERHTARLQDSADYFGFRFDRTAWLKWLEEVSRSLPPVDHKVRVRLSRAGELALTTTPLSEIARAPLQKVALAQQPIDSADIFLYHKTSRRALYDTARAARPACADVILWNERGEITESCSANIVIELEAELITPPLECGLLGGTFRGWLIDQGQISERVISIELARSARRLYLINSVRKWMDAVLID